MKKKEDEETRQKKNVTCHNYNKRGHYKPDCPLLKKYPKRVKKRAILRIWRDSDTLSSNEEEEAANICLMAIEDELNSENSFQFIFDELLEVFNDLMDEFKKLKLKNKEIKRLNLLLVNKKSKLLIEKKYLK